MAKRLGYRRNVYSEFESWRSEYHTPEPTLEIDMSEHRIGPLATHEKCMIYRRRAGINQGKIAADLGISRLWVNRMETGKVACDRLVEYWEV